MSDLLLDMNPISPTFGDLVISNNDLRLTPDTLTAIQEHILQRLRVYLGEWFMDGTIGVPYYQQILVKNPDQSKIDAIFQNVILGTPGVIALNTYSFSPNFTTRQLSITFSAQTTQGTVDYAGLI